jgi:hypothetical protein
VFRIFGPRREEVTGRQKNLQMRNFVSFALHQVNKSGGRRVGFAADVE